ncbi:MULTISPECIES: hypothetical protein [Vibrio harveyi group]|uniref:hypothetical protein n=1 Tax=Vibrio harveyi group TaxID=717610 RepID=UPI0004A4AE87|nr:hypothetical protein [Vibrio parahaemolyticus]EGR0027702.1 hypothetical protein [Vibrio alginolyticus]EHR0228190.1 hypothetical protein [Vibrio parahaemolyticus]MRE03853.1 hypothetical protein [Vibrio parahaemolyticus]RXP62020.1 hypothetical protein EGL73_00450 [Vibrio parahaemolyticus]RXP63741.1 hypothetical protein EGL72_00435 [Vibrio parahaemolyticus]
MEDNSFFTNLSSLDWWIGVVVVGLVINILSAYLKPALDSFLSNLSYKWVSRNKRSADQRKKWIKELQDNEHEQVLCYLEFINQKIWSIMYLMVAFVFFWMLEKLETMSVLGLTIIYVSIVFSLLLAFLSLHSGMTHYFVLQEARKKKIQ